MDFISPFKNQLEIWSNLIFKDILFDSKINEMSSKALNDKIIYHRCVCYIAQFENYIFGSFIGETIPFAEEKMSSAIENDWKHFIFSLQNPQNLPFKVEPQYHEDFTSLFVYGTLNKRNIISSPNAFFINVGNNSYVTKNLFDYYQQPEGISIDLFAGCCQPKRFEVERLVVIELTEKQEQ